MSLLPAFQVNVLNPAFGFVFICLLLGWTATCITAGGDSTSPAHDVMVVGIVIFVIIGVFELIHLILLAV